MSGPFNPYYEWLSIPGDGRRPNHYQLLGVQLFEANTNVIENAADRQMAHLRTFKASAHAAQSQRLLNEVAGARICLLKAEHKAAYDAQLRAMLGQRPPGAPIAAAAPIAALPFHPAQHPGQFQPVQFQPTQPAELRPAQPGQFQPAQPAAMYPAPGAPQAGPAQQPEPAPLDVIDSFVVRGSAPSAVRNNRAGAGRKRPGRAPQSGFSGPAVYTIVISVVGVIGLIAVLWLRMNHRQIHIVEEADAVAPNVDAPKKSAKRSDSGAASDRGAATSSNGEQKAQRDGGPATRGSEASPPPLPRKMPLIVEDAQPSAAPVTPATAFRSAYGAAGNDDPPAIASATPAQAFPRIEMDNGGAPKPAMEKSEPAPADADGWVDLLAWAEGVDWAPRGIDWNDACERPPTKDGVTLKARAFNHFPLPAIINGDYDMEVEFTRHQNVHSVNVFFPVGIHNMHLELGAQNVSGVHWINGKWALGGGGGNETTRGSTAFSNNVKHHVAIHVRQDGDHAAFNIDWDDIKDFIAWKGMHSQLTNLDGSPWKLSMVRRPWIGAFESRTTFHKVRIRMTSGEIRRDFATAADRQKDLEQGFVRLIDLPSYSSRVGWGRFVINQIHLERGPADEERLWPLIAREFLVCPDFYGAHAPSRLKCPIPKGAKSFSTYGYCDCSRTVKYLVYVDGVEMYASGVTGIADIKIDLPAGAQLLELVVDDAGNFGRDASYWCNPRFHRVSSSKLSDAADKGKLTPLKFTIASSTVGFGSLTHNAPINGFISIPVALKDAIPCDEFIFAHAPSTGSYAIPAGMTRFTAIGYCVLSRSVKFQVWADTKMIYESPAEGIIPIDVKLPAGARTLELRIDDLGNLFDDTSMWCYPRLHRK